jgi:NADH-quinone oxidoreductase subunit M
MIILSGISLFYGVFPTSLIDYTAKIEKALGFKEVIETTGLVIEGNNGDLHATLITGIFAFGFIIALAIFMIAPKSRKVGLMDTYTAGEFLYTPELYHYSFSYYAPFERLYAKHPDIVALYAGLVQRMTDFGKFIRFIFFSKRPATGVLWILITLILLVWGEKL